ncbi:hypothetical protein HHK36_008756 [Tetracentron sinense]|uniref:Syringolide-induced protein 14-1-1 n=1 Tax=Tetracentron sinense TaxID=13715 RepID=A0A835DKB0_TETSI|nr:hypothetical protein HHK36_008756 [Tetracentron sinense]
MILRFLPRAASSVTFQNPPFTPGREKRTENSNKLKANAGKWFSGPIIPAGAPRKSKNGSFDSQEPTSPKVSCMGQIKHKKKIHKSKRVSPPQESKPASSPRKVKKQSSALRSIFGGAKPGRKSDASAAKPPLPDRAPSLSQMKRFASGRDAFTNFEWTAQGVKVRPDYYSDEERGDQSDEEDEVLIPFSAPMVVGGRLAVEPRKEVNLWKRRTMAPPRPLQLRDRP